MTYAKGEVYLEDLLRGISPIKKWGMTPVKVNGITSDSRAVRQGFLFIALEGVHQDGHKYIDSAVARGARVVMVNSGKLEGLEKSGGVHYMEVEDTREVYGTLCSHFFDDPSEEIRLVGVTGTNGKTSVVRFLHQLALHMGYQAGVISTISCMVNNRKVNVEGHMTTPDAIVINGLLRDMVTSGCQYAFMEVSSHSMVQRRVEGLHFAGGVFTNLTRDHLDYHGSVKAYRDAKKQFFDMLPEGSFMLYNAEDRNGEFMAQNTKAVVKTFATQQMADYRVKFLQEIPEGMEVQVDGSAVWVPLHGGFNVENLAAVYGVAVELGFDRFRIPRALSSLLPVEGRFEVHRGPEGRLGIVDFAHTPSALASLLKSVHEMRPEGGRVITVFGAGGDRDRGKRPEMGKEVSTLSDWVVLTSDNPRGEHPMQIIREIYAGILKSKRGNTLLEADRHEAIHGACMLSRPGDIVVVAGKGHEKTQILAHQEIPFDDAKELELAFEALVREQSAQGVEEGQPE